MIKRRFEVPLLCTACAVVYVYCFALAATNAETPDLRENPKPIAQPAVGSEITIRSSAITAGGVKSSGGEFSATGTSGQPAIGAMSGGGFTMSGGFSPAPAIVFPPGVLADSTGIGKSRFISFSIPTGTTGETALRIKLTSLHHVVPPYTGGASVPFTSFEGQVRWVGSPVQYVESTSNATPLYAASLQCTPHYQDWSTVGLLHVTGSAIVPSSIYEVENVAASCAGVEANCAAVSVPLSISTTRWGDVEVPYNPPSTTTQPDVADISALVNKFRSSPSAPIKARAFLAGDDAFGNITTLNVDLGFSHIAACVDAFRGKPYPFTIQACP